MVETQVMILGRYLHTFQTSGECSCAVCRKLDGKDSIFCSGFSFWVLKKCSDIQDILVEDPDVKWRRCIGNAQKIHGRPCVGVQLADDKIHVVENVFYLGDRICPDGDCGLTTIKRCCFEWGKFR